MLLRVLFLVFCFALISGLYEGDFCEKDGQQGTCVNFKNCQSALDDVKKKKQPKICTFQGADSIVCCIDSSQQVPSATTTKRPQSSTTTEYMPEEYEYEDINRYGDECEPIPTSLTSPKTGQKAFDKCVDYQEKFVYPCQRSVTLTGQMTRGSNCHHNADELIVGGVDAGLHEFPHMAMIGYGERSNIKWLCGGSIISENFILTAGHCIADRSEGNASYIVIGVHTRSNAERADDSKIFRIKRIIRHPNYTPPMKYNDIALMETDRPMDLDQYTVPACLDTGSTQFDDKASATGWGLTVNRGATLSESLQKVILTKFTQAECEVKFPMFRHMKRGVDHNTQICYGDKTMSKDTCQGDSGGPLQIKSRALNCMYIIVGVTSFGKACGFAGDPGIYTRVSAYVPWIESVVWP